MKRRSIQSAVLSASVLLALPAAQAADAPAAPRLKLGAYYFAGWSGKSPYDDGSVSNAWAKGMPTHFTKKLGTEYAGRTPVWGWREDAPLEQKRKALWYYNRSAVYVNTVLMVYEELEK